MVPAIELLINREANKTDGGSNENNGTTIVVAITATAVLVMAACASRKEAPDPAAVQEQIADYRAQEIELVRSTVLDADRADRLIALLDKRDQLTSDHVQEIIAHRKEVSALNANYDART